MLTHLALSAFNSTDQNFSVIFHRLKIFPEIGDLVVYSLTGVKLFVSLFELFNQEFVLQSTNQRIQF